MTRFPRALFHLCALVCAAAPIQAQDCEVAMGAQVIVAIIQRGPENLVRGKVAPGGALFMDFLLKGPSAVRLRADALQGPRFDQGENRRRGSTWGVGADYLFYPSGKAGDGVYALLSARCARYRDEVETPTGLNSTIKNTIGTAIGVGYTFPHITDLCLRMTHERIQEVNLDSVQLVVGFRF